MANNTIEKRIESDRDVAIMPKSIRCLIKMLFFLTEQINEVTCLKLSEAEYRLGVTSQTSNKVDISAQACVEMIEDA